MIPAEERNAIQELLIIFYKNPIAGKVKQRLASSIGDKLACQFYEKLAMRTQSAIKNVSGDKAVFYSDFVAQSDIWPAEEFLKLLQQGKDLGDRMRHAFKWAFAKGYTRVVLIGTDLFYLDQHLVETAFSNLHKPQITIGPAYDGGYYLIGMTKLIPPLFQNIPWSSPEVFEKTIAICKSLNLPYNTLPKRADIDRIEDLVYLRSKDRQQIYSFLGMQEGERKNKVKGINS